jgi:thiol-disulfide isomerase/thioredoxin
MDSILFACRLLLIWIFATAALAKLSNRFAFRTALAGFGVPGALVSAIGALVPAAELAVAAALVPRETARGGAVGSLALLALFTAAIAVALGRGVQVECNCFGAVEMLSHGFSGLLRNSLLLAVAAVLAALGGGNAGPTVGRPMGVLASLAGGLLLVIAGAVLFRRRLKGKQAREPVSPEVTPVDRLVSLDGATIDLRASGPTLVVFWDPMCPPCRYMTPRLAAWEQEPPAGSPTLVLVSKGGAEKNREAGLRSPIVLDENREILAAFGLPGRPAAVLIDSNGTIARGLLGAAPILAALGAPS